MCFYASSMSIRLRHFSIGAAAATVAATALVAAPAHAARVTCQGVPATIVSSAANIVGTPGRDVIVVKGSGAHTVSSGAGNDLICGSAGADTINAGPGRDVVAAGAGSDVIDGGSGVDVLVGGAGADRIYGAAGADVITGGSGVDALQGGTGIDKLAAGAGTNFCANDPADVVTGSCTIDTAAPAVVAAPASFSATAGSTITFTWSLSDPSGISYTGLTIGGPSGWVTNWCGFGLEGTLVAGTPQDGTYQAKCDVPATAVSQDYTAFFKASDVFGSSIQFMEMPFTIIGGVSDTSPPVVTNIEVLPSTVGIGQDFIVRYTVTDESGVGGAIVWLAFGGYNFADNGGRGYVDMSNAPVLVSGDAKSGTYEITVRMMDYAPLGSYTVWTSAVDIYGNKALEQTAITFTVQ